MKKVKVVTAYVPLDVKHLNAEKYHEYGRRLADVCGDRLHFFDNFPLADCWLSKENPPMLPAAPVPSDRYATPADNVRSNIVQHSRTQWALAALASVPDTDVIVWLDLAIFKQGYWNGNPVTEKAVADFLHKVETVDFEGIPFPGIEDAQPIKPHSNNWRFCGSTHIWPVQYLDRIDYLYRMGVRSFIHTFKCTPLDLAIWPAVENVSGLPFRWYKAEYDATQLTNFPEK